MASIAPSMIKASRLPVAVFVGGTSGIGQGMAEVFAEQTKGESHIIIVGRNRDAGERILDALPKSSSQPTAGREFIECDATLMKNIDHATKQILSRHERINYLVISCGFSALGGRDETSEGIDKKLAVHYYARWKFINDLLPALERAKNDGADATVCSVMAPTYGGEIDVDDFALKKTYSTAKAALVAPTYNDLMTESFAKISPELTFIHAHPGFVRTNYMSSSRSAILRATSPLLMSPFSPVGWLMRTMSTSRTETGQYMWKAINETTKARPGAWRIDARGNDFGMKRYYGNDAQRQALWKHTEEVMAQALS